MPIQLGNERLFDEVFHLVEGKRVGLITNQSGVNSNMERTADRMHRTSGVELRALFGPEHGFRGDSEDGVRVDTERDAGSGVPVYSLYGLVRQPGDAMLRELDVVVCDIQDVGVRFYTYVSTIYLAMKACAERAIPFVILDRPNPIGAAVEGNVLDPAFASFVGIHPIPVRYGMTLGELARLLNEDAGVEADLNVVEMAGWRRDCFWEETHLEWVPPSPNMPSVETAVVYPGMCFFEGTNISEGRGTARPFEQVGAPFIDGFRLADELNSLLLPGAAFRPVRFVPAFGKYEGQSCGGAQLHVVDRTNFLPVTTGFEAVAAVKRRWPEHFAWRIPEEGIHNFDKLAGTDRIRLALDAGAEVADLALEWEAERRPFMDLRGRHLLY